MRELTDRERLKINLLGEAMYVANMRDQHDIYNKAHAVFVELAKEIAGDEIVNEGPDWNLGGSEHFADDFITAIEEAEYSQAFQWDGRPIRFQEDMTNDRNAAAIQSVISCYCDGVSLWSRKQGSPWWEKVESFPHSFTTDDWYATEGWL